MTENFEGGLDQRESSMTLSVEDIKAIFLDLDKISGLTELDLTGQCGNQEELDVYQRAKDAFDNLQNKFGIPDNLFAKKFHGLKWEEEIRQEVTITSEDLEDVKKSLKDLGVFFEREWESGLPDESIELAESAREAYQQLCTKLQ